MGAGRLRRPPEIATIPLLCPQRQSQAVLVHRRRERLFHRAHSPCALTRQVGFELRFTHRSVFAWRNLLEEVVEPGRRISPALCDQDPLGIRHKNLEILLLVLHGHLVEHLDFQCRRQTRAGHRPQHEEEGANKEGIGELSKHLHNESPLPDSTSPKTEIEALVSNYTVQMRRGTLVWTLVVSTAGLLSPVVVSGATVSGRVVAAATGVPLPRAAVVLRRDTLRDVRTATTDGQGRYEFDDVPAGRYDLSASKTGYVQTEYGQARTLQANQQEQIDFRLIRAGAISGRVTDDFGEPVEARIAAQRFEFIAGVRRLAPIGRTAQSNDLGEFRLYGLPPGQYYLGATTTYAPTYYPGTVIASEAQPITIAAGQDVTNIGIAILPIRTARISGTAIESNGRPMSGAAVIAMQGGMGGRGDQVRSDGSFTIADVAPGEYTIKVSQRLGDAQQVASASVSINGEDVTGLTLVAQKPAAVRGRVVLEVGDAGDRSTLRLDALRVHALRVSPEETVAIGISAGAVDSQGAFEVTVPSGPTLLRFAGLPSGWQLKAVRLNSLDVTDGGLDLPADQVLEGVELVISNRPSGISGSVTDASNRSMANCSVVIFPEDRRQWNFQSRYLTRSRADAAGGFTAANLPPGAYLAIAVSDLGPGEELDPTFLERALVRATRFSLLEGETRTLDLKLQTVP
jgi:hypothetical protein